MYDNVSEDEEKQKYLLNICFNAKTEKHILIYPQKKSANKFQVLSGHEEGLKLNQSHKCTQSTNSSSKVVFVLKIFYKTSLRCDTRGL